jgi:hypothetical protein
LLKLGPTIATPIAPAAARSDDDVVVLSELVSPNPSDPNHGRSPAYRGSLFCLAEGNYVYIRNEGEGGEELFDQREDPHELTNLARDAAMRPVLRRFREHLAQTKTLASAVDDHGASPTVASNRAD